MPGKVTKPNRVPSKAVLLSDIPVLTLRNGKPTTSRRTAAAPQLKCIGRKDVCDLYQVEVMQCTNMGVDYDAANVQWACQATVPQEFKLGVTDVICEGYESSDDPYVLKGSCGVEYGLILTEKGQQKYGKNLEPEQSSAVGILVLLVFALVIFVIGRAIWTSCTENRDRQRVDRPNGGNNNDNDDPPPPYDGPPPSYYRQAPKPRAQYTAPRRTTTGTAGPSRPAPPRAQQQQAWRPGFWTGTVAGAAAGYFTGRRNGRQSETARQPETQQRPGGFWNNFGGPSTGQQRVRHSPPSPPTRSSPSPTQFHQTSGFGETRRR